MLCPITYYLLCLFLPLGCSCIETLNIVKSTNKKVNEIESLLKNLKLSQNSHGNSTSQNIMTTTTMTSTTTITTTASYIDINDIGMYLHNLSKEF